MLKILTGLAQHHTQTQVYLQSGKHKTAKFLYLKVLVGEVIPHLHLMEQVSSSEHIGTMAENLLRVLSENESVNAKVFKLYPCTR